MPHRFSPRPISSSRLSCRPTGCICLLLALVTVAAYWEVQHCDFLNYDDAIYVTDNPMVQPGLTWAGLKWAFQTGHAGNWHPLTWCSHMLDCQLYGARPAGHHLTNLLLHVANTLLLFLVLQRMTGALWRSALVAALFAWHPLHVESVAWVAERKDVLSAFFFMLTIWAYGRYVEVQRLKSKVQSPGVEAQSPKSKVLSREITDGSQNAESSFTLHAPRSTLHASPFYLLSLCCFALGLLSKPMLVTLPFVLLLLDYWPLGRSAECGVRRAESGAPEVQGSARGWTRLVAEKIPFFALSLASSVVTFIAQRNGGAVATLSDIPLCLRAENGLIGYACYLRKTFWPADLAVLYPLQVSWRAWEVIGAGALLAGLSALAVWRARRQPALLVGWLWFLGMLVPVIGWVQVGNQLIADRYTYLPLIGWFVMVVWGLAGLPARRPALRWLGCGVAVLALAACVVLTRLQLAHWKNSEALFRHTIKVTSDNGVAHGVLGDALVLQHKWPEAAAELRLSIRYLPIRAKTYLVLGRVLEEMGKYAEAESYFRQALKRNLTRPDPDAISKQVDFRLVNVLAAQGKHKEAEACYRAALAAGLVSPEGRCQLANLLARAGKFDEAVEQYRMALKIRPAYAEACNNLANALAEGGRSEEALAEYRQALHLLPNHPRIYYNLGAELAKLNRLEEAGTNYERALQLKPDYPDAHSDLAALRQRQHRFDQAIAHYQSALQFVPDSQDALLGLAELLATCPEDKLRNGGRAVELAEKAGAAATNQTATLVRPLADAYAETGRFAEALRVGSNALVLAEAAHDAQQVESIRQRLRRYQSRLPWREP